MAVRSLFSLCPSSLSAFSLPSAEEPGLILLRVPSLEPACVWEIDERIESAAAIGTSIAGGVGGGEDRGGGVVAGDRVAVSEIEFRAFSQKAE